MRTPIVIGHRGAPGHRPEHTLPGYELAVRMGRTSSSRPRSARPTACSSPATTPSSPATTDIAGRPDLAHLRREDGWFVEDLKLAQLRTLRAVERLPDLRTTAYDGHDGPVPTLDDILALRARLSAELGRVVGVYLELKDPARFARLGLPLGPPLLASLEAAGLNTPDAPVIVESFESLRELRDDLRVPIGRLVEPGAEVPVAEIAEYAQAVGAHKDLVDPARRRRPPHHADPAGGRGPRGGPARALLDVPGRGAVPPGGPRRRGRAHRVLRGGVDGVFADSPDTAVAARRSWMMDR